jgi:hypothetical protein
MERRAVELSVVCAAMVLIILSICQADGEDDLNAAFAAAPSGVRELQCRDVAPLSRIDLASFRRWFDQVMAPVARVGMSLDQIYSQFLVDCVRNQNLSAIAVALELRKLLKGMTPQHAGGK